MSQAAEIDIHGEKKGGVVLRRQTSSVRDIQRAMSKLDPQVLRMVMSYGGEGGAVGSPRFGVRYSSPVSPTPTVELFGRRPQSPLQLADPSPRSPGDGCHVSAAPLTIFYDGKVNVFYLRGDIAEEIIRWAESTSAGRGGGGRKNLSRVLTLPRNNIPGGGEPKVSSFEMIVDIPLARRKSLQRFLRKRQERLTARASFAGSPDSSTSTVDFAGRGNGGAGSAWGRV